MIEVPLELSQHLREQLLDHLRQCLPNEGCALLIGIDGEVTEVVATTNVDASPTSFTVDPNQVLAAHNHAEQSGLELIGVAHSHPNGPPEPSVTDIAGALDPGWLYLIAGSDESLKAWRMDG